MGFLILDRLTDIIYLMKKLLLISFFLLLAGCVAIYLFLFYSTKKKEASYCGSWGPLVGGEPTCECDGEIVKKGGPSGPADDGGGYYECVGLVTSRP